MWNKNYSNCQSCGSTEWSHNARGYCKKCYPIINSLSKVNAWDENNSATWKPIPGFGAREISTIANDKFIRAKDEIIRQLNSRLRIIKATVNPETVSSIDIEYALDNLAEIILKEKGEKMFHGHASSYIMFKDEQLKIIYKDLNYILLKKRFTLDITKIFKA